MSIFYYDPVAYEFSALKILVPDPVQVKQSYEKGEQTNFPYWSRIWPSALALAAWLEQHGDMIAGKKVVEIGAGLGLPSFVAARYASSVLITDHVPEAITWIDLNVSDQGNDHISTALIDWREKHLPDADIVLMSDIGYHEDDFAAVHEMIRNFIGAGSVVLLTVPSRMISSKFIKPLEPYVTVRELVTAQDTDILFLQLGLTDFP